MQRTKRSIAICGEALQRLLEFVKATGFADTATEIVFFKTMKPQLESRLLYQRAVLDIELEKPAGSVSIVQHYYEQELEKIRGFYAANSFLVSYYRSGETLLDDKLFVQAERAGGLFGSGVTGGTNEVAALSDGFAAALLANEKLAGWLNAAIAAASEKPAIDRERTGNIKWTDSKAELVELVYALYRKGSFNNGEIALRDVAIFLEKIFDVDIGNYYRAFQEIRIRKKGRTTYLDSLKNELIRYMDDTDLNYKG